MMQLNLSAARRFNAISRSSQRYWDKLGKSLVERNGHSRRQQARNLRILPAVAGRSLKVIAQAVGNGSSVADWNYRQFSQDTFHWNDVVNCQWFFVV